MNTLRILFPLAAAAIAFAQPPTGAPQPSFDNIKSYLGLSANTIQTIQQAIQQSATANQTLAQQLHDKQIAISDLLAKGTTDAAAVGKLVLEAEAIRKQLKASNDALNTTVVSYLTADQKTKLKALDDAAKLQPAIAEAGALHLLILANAPGGPGGPGMRGMGPGMPGMGAGPGPMGGGPGGMGPMGFRRPGR